MKRVTHKAVYAWHVFADEYAARDYCWQAYVGHTVALSGALANDNARRPPARRPTTRAGRAARSQAYRERLWRSAGRSVLLPAPSSASLGSRR